MTYPVATYVTITPDDDGLVVPFSGECSELNCAFADDDSLATEDFLAC